MFHPYWLLNVRLSIWCVATTCVNFDCDFAENRGQHTNQKLIHNTLLGETMEEHDAASSLRARIMEIQRNSSLSPQEKGRQIQLLMTSRYRTSSDMVAASPTSLYSSPRVTYRDEETKQEMGCKHYIRAASIKAPCCDQWFPCRLCHDESVTTHRINRYEVLYMFCYYCELEQPFSGTCRDCGKAVGAYSCSQCKFLTSNPNAGDIFHCDQCGLCRVGPRERYEHCEVCHMCMPAGQVHRHIVTFVYSLIVTIN